jgi:predicted peptidase
LTEIHIIASEFTHILGQPCEFQVAGPYPLVLFLHGRGESGPADGSELARCKAHGPLKVAEAGPDGPGLPAGVLNSCFIVSPQCQDAPDSWSAAGTVARLKGLLDELLAAHVGEIDPDRVYLTGLSMGGAGTFTLANAFPELFAACLPICGGILFHAKVASQDG